MKKQIQITAGRGPVECEWVVSKLIEELIKEAQRLNIQFEVLELEKGSKGGTIQSAICQLNGDRTEEFLPTCLGVVQWIGKSSFRENHKRKNWFVGVQEISSTNTIELDLSKLKIETMRSSGPGGQHANKVSTAVRITHLPSGEVVSCSKSRSQLENKRKAIELLKLRMLASNNEQQKEQERKNWVQHLDLKRGNPIRVYQGEKFKLIKVKKIES